MFEHRIYESVDESCFNTSKDVLRVSHEFDLPRSTVWAGLRDAETWTKWLPLDRVEWTSPEPFSAGTTRTVTVAGREVKELFFGWEEGYAMSFAFAEGSLPMQAFAEDYRLKDLPGGGCELTLTNVAKANRVALALARPLAKVILKRSMRKFEAYLKANRARFE